LKILGEDIKQYQTPKAKDGTASAGLVLKHEEVTKRASSLEEMLQKKVRCFKGGCPHNQGGAVDVPIKDAANCQYRNQSGCAGNKELKRPMGW
jgi:hypothetical protein